MSILRTAQKITLHFCNSACVSIIKTFRHFSSTNIFPNFLTSHLMNKIGWNNSERFSGGNNIIKSTKHNHKTRSKESKCHSTTFQESFDRVYRDATLLMLGIYILWQAHILFIIICHFLMLSWLQNAPASHEHHS